MITDIKVLANAIQQANRFFLSQIQKQVNTSFTLRNWMIGYYLAEYEQNGKDRAEYGEQLYKKLSEKLKKKGVKGLSLSSLHLFKQRYFIYPDLCNVIPYTSHLIDLQSAKAAKIFQTVSGKSSSSLSSVPQNPITLLLNRLSFSHFVELIKS